MAQLQIRSATPPFDTPAIGLRTARLLSLAEAMGLLSRAEPVAHLNFSELRSALEPLSAGGIGRDAFLTLRDDDTPESLAETLDRLYEQLEGSPNPNTEWPAQEERLGAPLLQRLVGVSPASLRRYSGGERETPQAVAARLHFLAQVIAHLAGGYNDFGIRRWFDRSRTQLDGRSPAQLLTGSWDPDDDEPMQVLELAQRLTSSPAA